MISLSIIISNCAPIKVPRIKRINPKLRFGELDQRYYNFDHFKEALEEARNGYASGGIPIGSVLVYRNSIIGRGHNRRVQDNNSILHAEIAALQNAGRQPLAVYQDCTLYTTLSPCAMCSGAIILYQIPRVVIGENRNFKGSEDLLRSKGIDIILLDNQDSYNLLHDFISKNPDLWFEDIGTDVNEIA
jgi:cytosine/creatinine deaminase